MPTYTYKCNSCNHEFDRILKIADRLAPEQEQCPNCKEKTVTKSVVLTHLGDPIRLGFTRPDSSIKDVLQKIHERAPGSELNKTSTLTRL